MDTQYEKDARLILLNLAIGLGTFIQILDTSIANVAIPYIAGNLSVSPDQGTWVITSFAASNAIVLPLTGWLSDYFGRVRLFVVSVLLFSFVSFLCALSTSLTMLVILRVIQGAVAGSLIPLSQSLIVTCNPPESRGSALGYWGMIVIVAPILGPIIGGYLTQEYSWPWIFYINVPIGLFAAATTWAFLKDKESQIIRNPIDWTGLILLTIGVGCLQVMLDKGKDLDWFESNTIITLTIVSAISLLYFIIWTSYQKFPIVDFSFFKNRNFTFGTIAITLGFLTYFGSTVIIPLWLQTEMNYTPLWAGIAVAPVGIPAFILAGYVGKNLHRFDLRILASISFLFFSASSFYQTFFNTQIDIYNIMIARLIMGFGVAIFFLPLLQLSLGEIPPERYASASGLFNFIRILIGSGFGTSLTIELWSWREIFHHARLAETITPFMDATHNFYQNLSSYHVGFTPGVITGVVDQLVEQQAYLLSTLDLSWIMAWLAIAMIPVVFMCKKVGAKGGHAAMH